MASLQTPPQPLLAICISSYNRADYIGETLNSILSQVTDEVEVVVLDAASKDNTPQIVGALAAKHPQLRYIRRETSAGFDEKYAELGKLTGAEYCWFFTDDDIIKPGAVRVVLDACKQGYSFITVNAEVRNQDLSVCLQERRVKLTQDTVYEPTAADWDRLFADTCMYLTFVGGIVVKRHIWNEREQARYFGTMFVHLGILYQNPMPGKSLLIAHPWIISRYGLAQWRPRSFEIWMFLFPDLVWAFPKLSDWAKEKAELREPWANWPRLLMARALKHYSLNEYRSYISPRSVPWWKKLPARIIASLPFGLMNGMARFLIGTVLRKKPSMTLFELEECRK